MAPKKKKKPAANPARGFATTSLPSRSKATEEAEPVNLEESTITPRDAAASNASEPSWRGQQAEQNTILAQGGAGIHEMSPEELEAHLENAELEGLIEKHASRSMTEANRQVSKLEAEKRQLRLQATRISTYHWLSDDTVNALFELNEQSSKTLVPPAGTICVSDQDEKLLIDLWTLQRVLKALNFPKIHDAVIAVARQAAVHQLSTSSELLPGLAEAFEWYALNSENHEIPDYEHGLPHKSMQLDGNTQGQENSGRSFSFLRNPCRGYVQYLASTTVVPTPELDVCKSYRT